MGTNPAREDVAEPVRNGPPMLANNLATAVKTSSHNLSSHPFNQLFKAEGVYLNQVHDAHTILKMLSR